MRRGRRISRKRYALSRRQEAENVTCFRMQRAATQGDDNPEKRAHNTNELSATVVSTGSVPATYKDFTFLRFAFK